MTGDAGFAYMSRFQVADKVVIDGEKSIVVTVIGLWWGANDRHLVEVSWLHNGGMQSATVDYFRLELAAAA